MSSHLPPTTYTVTFYDMVDMSACDASTGGTGSGSVNPVPPPLHGLVPVKPRHLLSSDIPLSSLHRHFNDHHTIHMHAHPLFHALTPISYHIPSQPNYPHPFGSRSRSRFLGKTPSVSGSSLMDLRTQISLLVTSSLLASMLNRCLNESDDTRHGIAYGDASYTLPLQVTGCTILCCVCYIPLLLSFFCYPLPRDRTLDSGSRCFLSFGVPTITLDLHFLHSRFSLRKHIHYIATPILCVFLPLTRIPQSPYSYTVSPTTHRHPLHRTTMMRSD